jgi:superfamily II DNA/RNA helicase
MSTTFADLGVPESLCNALAKRRVTEPFPIQAAAISDALAGRDVSGKAPTGSGKTLAFGLPVLARVDRSAPMSPSALILAPTRELAEQIKSELQPLAGAVDRSVAAVYGGVGYGPQKSALRRGVDVLVATPGRLEDLIEQSSIRLDSVSIVVVDEADRMADMGFLPAVKRILNQTSKQRQTMLFSATLDGEVGRLASAYQRHPMTHTADAVDGATPDATHHFWLVDKDERIDRTAEVIASSDKVLVFTRTRYGADRLARQLGQRGVEVAALHGGRSQNQRRRALAAFSNGRTDALIATDLAARGLHVDDVSTVIHFDPVVDSKDYVHRSGRTARAGAKGTVVSLVMRDQHKAVTRMQRDLGMNVSIDRGRSFKKTDSVRSRPAAENARPPSKRIYVGNLPWKSSEGDLHDLFSRHGHVVEATVARRNGRSKGYGFVEMSEGDASVALDALSSTDLAGRRLQIRYAW